MTESPLLFVHIGHAPPALKMRKNSIFTWNQRAKNLAQEEDKSVLTGTLTHRRPLFISPAVWQGIKNRSRWKSHQEWEFITH